MTLVSAPTETLRALLTSADELLAFECDPVDGSFQVCPPALDVHLAGEFVHRALALLDKSSHRIHCYRGNPDTKEFEPFWVRLVPDPEAT